MTYLHAGIDALSVPRSTRLIVADYGTSYGRSSVQRMTTVSEYLRRTKKPRAPPIFIHNDLPTNDWTHLFEQLARQSSYHGLASGRSFYEQCLPSNSLSLGFSSASLHYLSSKPCPIAEHCFVHFATDDERQRFRHKAKLDWDRFLKHRSEELHSHGILALNIPSADDHGRMGFDRYFDLIYQCARSSSLLTPNELLDFTLPFYLRSFDDCVDEELFQRYALTLIKAEFVPLKSFVFDQYQQGRLTRQRLAESLTLMLRPGTELALQQALHVNGRSNEAIDGILAQFWSLVEREIRDEPDHECLHTYATLLILKKI